jgi:hypothetical protein
MGKASQPMLLIVQRNTSIYNLNCLALVSLKKVLGVTGPVSRGLGGRSGDDSKIANSTLEILRHITHPPRLSLMNAPLPQSHRELQSFPS